MEKNNKPPFLIEEGVLKKYNGPGGEVSVPAGVTAIGPKAFMECDSLTGVTLPEGMTSVGEQAFMYCQNLRSINFPKGLTSRGKISGTKTFINSCNYFRKDYKNHVCL